MKRENKPKTYRVDLTDNWEQFNTMNKYENSGFIFVESLKDIYRLMEDEWGNGFCDHTDRLSDFPNKMLYCYLSKYGSTAFVHMEESCPFSGSGITILNLKEESLKKTLMSLGIEYYDGLARFVNIFS